MLTSSQKALLRKAHSILLVPETNDVYDLAVLEDQGLLDRSLFLTETGRPLARLLWLLTDRQVVHLERLYFKGESVENLCEIFKLKPEEIELWVKNCL